MTTSESTAASTRGRALRRLYIVRFVFAAIWAGVLLAAAAATTSPGPLITVLLVLYPLFDAGAVLWQLRAGVGEDRSRAAEWANVAVSVAVAVALGFSSSTSLAAALAVWGAWAIGAGLPQLVTAVRNRRSGGQVAQMLSGGISLVAGAGFLLQGLRGEGSLVGAAGYATLGAIFFLVSAILLTLRRRRAPEA